MALNPFAILTQLRQWTCVAHHIPGRVRLKFNSGALGYLAQFKLKEIEQLVAQLPELHSYRLNCASGSLLLEYNSAAITPDLIDQLFHPDEQHAQHACKTLMSQLNCTSALEIPHE